MNLDQFMNDKTWKKNFHVQLKLFRDQKWNLRDKYLKNRGLVFCKPKKI